MIRKLALALAFLCGLSACGVDGEPIPPSEVEQEPEGGITISGSVEVGVARTF